MKLACNSEAMAVGSNDMAAFCDSVNQPKASPNSGEALIMDVLILDMIRLSLQVEPVAGYGSRVNESRARPSRLMSKRKSRQGKTKLPRSLNEQVDLDGERATDPPKAVDDFTFSFPEYTTRWLKLASRVRLTEAPEGSKSQPHTINRPSFGHSIQNLRRTPRTISNTLYTPGSHHQPDKQRYSFKPFRLLDLPLEMRQSIYYFALQQSNSNKLFISLDQTSKSIPRISRLPHTAFSLLSTSKQLRTECLPILYQSNHFYARAIKHLPRILALPEADKHLRCFDLSFIGKSSKSKIFSHIDSITQLRQLKELNITLDYDTLLSLEEHVREGVIGELCQHHVISTQQDRDDHAGLLHFSGKRTQGRKLKLMFQHASGGSRVLGRRERSNEACVLDCVICAVLRGMREWKRIETADRESDKEDEKTVKKSKDRSESVIITVMRTTAQHAEEDLGLLVSKAYNGLWPILAPEPRACTDWRTCTALKAKGS